MRIVLREGQLPIITTKRLVLRDIRMEDISQEYVAWLNNPDINRFLEVRHCEQSLVSVREYVQSKLVDIVSSQHFGVYDSEGLRLVGTVTLPKINFNHSHSDVSFVIGHQAVQGYGYATEALHAVIYHVFKVLKLAKLWAGYYDGHIASARVLAKNGFREEGRLRQQLLDYRGERVDHVLVGLLAEEYCPNTQWLGALPAEIMGHQAQ